jgi:hypothetical protein
MNPCGSGWRTSFYGQTIGRAHETVLILGVQDEILTRNPQKKAMSSLCVGSRQFW